MNKAVGFIIGLVVVVVSFTYLFGYAIPNMQRAQEEVKIAQQEYDAAQAEADQAFEDLNQSIEEIQNEESIQ